MNKYGYEILQSLSDGQTLPNAGAEDSENMAYIGQDTGGRIAISIFAKTALSIAAAQSFSIELQAWTADDDASATSPFSTGGSLEDNAHVLLLSKIGGTDSQLDFAAGEMITQYIIPQFWLDKLNYDWVQLLYLTDANEESETVDAFTHFIA